MRCGCSISLLARSQFEQQIQSTNNRAPHTTKSLTKKQVTRHAAHMKRCRMVSFWRKKKTLEQAASRSALRNFIIPRTFCLVVLKEHTIIRNFGN
jgi:hypothetical protein